MARNNVIFKEVSLRAPGGESYINVIDQFQASSTFGGMSIEEGIFNGGLSGFIILNDPNPNNDVEGLPCIGNLAKTGAMIRFTFTTEILEEDISETLGVSGSGLEFYVYNVSIVSDISPGIVKLGSSQAVTYRLEFASYESTALNYQTIDIFPEDEDYVGTISDFVTELCSPDKIGVLAPSPNDLPPTDNIVMNTTMVGPEIFPTYNGAWFKRKQSLYPWGKEKGIPSLNTLVSASLNYAIPTVDSDKENEDRGAKQEKNASYVFYQSLPTGQWHLVPIGGDIVSDSGESAKSLYRKNYIDGSENDGFHTYRFTMDETTTKRIESFKLIKDKDLLELEEAGAFGSSYRLIEPNYRGIYNGINITSTDEDVSENTVYENSIVGTRNNIYYHDAMSVASHLRQEMVVYTYDEFISDGIASSQNPLLGDELVNGRENPAFSSLVDTVYGYFDTSYLYKPFPTRNDDYASSRGSRYMWQPIFDMCDLPLKTNSKTEEIGIDSIIQTRNEYERGRLAYAVLSDLKEQWNRYKNSVCCDSSIGGDKFLAMLVGATTGGPGEEEDDYDRDKVPFAIPDGATVGNLYRYSFVEVEVWPRALIPPGVTLGPLGITGPNIPAEDTVYYDYLISKDINPATGEKEIFLPGNSGGTGLTLSFGLSAGNIGQEYRINQEQEFFVLPVDGGRKGLFTAYNTIELTNNKAFTGAGINIRGYNYPSGFNLMPVGGMTSGQGGESDTNTTYIPPTFIGSVVEMSSINNQILNSFATNKTTSELDYDGPDTGEATDKTGPKAVVALLNLVVGTENLPTTFAGSSGELAYRNSNGDIVDIDRDDKGDRSNIKDDASPAPKVTAHSKNTNTTVYLFSAENDHDGRCST